MSNDLTETYRRERQAELNTFATERQELEGKYGQVWNTQELQQDFEVQGFMAPLVVVKRKLDEAKGTLEFQHNPRFYFNWQQD